MNIEELLLQLDSFCQNWPFLYLGRNHASIQLRAIGVGSNKQKPERTSRLASALAALLHEGGTYVCTGSWHRFCHPSRELLEEHELARMSQFLLIQPSTVPSVVSCPRSAQTEVPTNVVNSAKRRMNSAQRRMNSAKRRMNSAKRRMNNQ